MNAVTFQRAASASNCGVTWCELSPRELEILKLIALGWKTTQIAEKIGVMRKTVTQYRTNILVKLNFADDRDLVPYAWRNGVVK